MIMRTLLLAGMLSSVAVAQTTQPADYYPVLRKQLQDLRAEVERLRRENAGLLNENQSLKRRLLEMGKDEAQPAQEQAKRKIERGKLEIGMTLDEAMEAVRGYRDNSRPPPEKKSEDEFYDVYELSYNSGPEPVPGGGGFSIYRVRFVCRFDKSTGKLVSYTSVNPD